MKPKTSQMTAAPVGTGLAERVVSVNQAGPDQAKAPDPAAVKPRDPLVITHKDFLEVVGNIAYADPSDLVAIKVTPCRYCHGKDHAYQWRTIREFSEAHAEWACLPYKQQRTTREPTAEGGFGYTRNLGPDPCCPECDGWGIPAVHQKSSVGANGKSHPLYDGGRILPDGSSVTKMRNRLPYLNMIAKMMGYFKTPGSNGGPGEKTDTLSELLREIQKRGSMAPIGGRASRDQKQDP